LESPMWKKILGASACAGALVLTLAGPATAGAATTTETTSPSSSAVILTWYPKHVKSNVSDVRVFTSEHGYVEWGKWGPCTNFWVDRNDNGRYHTLIWYNNIQYDAWVTASSEYIADGHCG